MTWVRLDEALEVLKATGVETSRQTLYARINKGWRFGVKILGHYYVSAAWLAFPYDDEKDNENPITYKVCGTNI